MHRFLRHKDDHFTTISNVFLRDKGLSLKAKGFLAVIMSLPETWDFSINGICAVLKESKEAVYNTINELVRNDYCKVEKLRVDGKFAGTDYHFYQNPDAGNDESTKSKAVPRKKNKPQTVLPHTGNPDTGNPPQRNTYRIKDLKNKRKKEEEGLDDFIKDY